MLKQIYNFDSDKLDYILNLLPDNNIWTGSNTWTGSSIISGTTIISGNIVFSSAGSLIISGNTTTAGSFVINNTLEIVTGSNPLTTRSTTATNKSFRSIHGNTEKFYMNDTQGIAVLGCTQNAGGFAQDNLAAYWLLNGGDLSIVANTMSINPTCVFNNGLDLNATNAIFDLGGSAIIRSTANHKIELQLRKTNVAQWESGIYSVNAGSTPSSQLARVGGEINTSTTQIGNTAGTETAFFVYTVSGGTLFNNNDKLRFSSAGTFAATASVDKRIKVYFPSGVLIYDTGNLAITTANSWSIQGEIIKTSNSGLKSWVVAETSSSALTASTTYTSTPSGGDLLAGSRVMLLTGNGTNANDTVGEMWNVSWYPTPTP